jgi:hypothetical protein
VKVKMKSRPQTIKLVQRLINLSRHHLQQQMIHLLLAQMPEPHHHMTHLEVAALVVD